MSSPMRLSSEDMRRFAVALEAMTECRKKQEVEFQPYGTSQIRVADVALSFKWDEDVTYGGAYVIDDWSGS